MRPKTRKIKQLDTNMKLAIGSLADISETDDGRAVVIQELNFIRLPTPEVISVRNNEQEVVATLLEMCIRKSFVIRDTMGNVQDDFWGWNYVQYRSLNFLKGDLAEDTVNKFWYGVEALLNEVFVNIPYYALREIHYSVETREIVFIGDYRNATNRYVTFHRHQGNQTIVSHATSNAWSRW